MTEDDAFLLKERIFKDLAKKVKGSYSETFGLKISFADWLDPDLSKVVAKFLYDELVPKLIGMKSSELGYYEHGIGWNYCEEVDFSELFPTAGFYSFDKEGVVELQRNIGRIYYRNNHVCSVNDTSIIRYWAERDPIFKSGVSKIHRRGYFLGNLRIKWKNELKDILLF